MTVKIAEGFVEVSSKVDRAEARKDAGQAGQESGTRFSRAFSRNADRGMARQRAAFVRGYAQAGLKSGRVFAEAAARRIFRGRRGVETAASAVGARAGEEFAQGFKRGADGKLRDARGRFVAGMGGDAGFERDGRRSGGGFIRGIIGAFTGGTRRLLTTATGMFTKVGTKGWIIVVLVAAALAALPAIGAAAGTALTLAFGGGIAAIGIVAAAQAQQVKDAFSDLKDHVVEVLKDIAEPLEGTLVQVAADARSLFDELTPHLEQAFADMAPVLERFSGDLADAFSGGSVIDSATGAFNALLDSLGPRLEDTFGRMGAALNDLFGTVEENPDIFAGIITGLLDVVTGLIRFVDWLSRVYVWIQEKIPGGLLTLLMPLTGLTRAFLDTQDSGSRFAGALRDMAEAASEAWADIKAGVDDLREAVAPILDDITSALSDSDALDKVQEWWDRLAEIGRVAGEGLGAIFSRVATVITFIWEMWGERIIGWFSGVWTVLSGIVSGALEFIQGLLTFFLGVFTGDWERAWNGIKTMFSGLWTAIVGIVSGAWKMLTSIVMAIVDGIVAAFQWLYNKLVGNSIIPELVTSIVGFFRRLWDRAVEIFNGIKNFLVNTWRLIKNRVLAFVLGLRAGAIRAWLGLRDKTLSVFRWIRDKATNLWSNVRDWVVSRAWALRNRVRDAVQSLKDKVIDAFEKARDGVRRAWNKLRNIAKAPVRFIIQTVYNQGIRRLWNKVADKVPGLGELRPMSLPRGFARGGVLPGRSSWRGGDTHLRPMREGEGVYVSEAMADPFERARLKAINAAAMRGGPAAVAQTRKRLDFGGDPRTPAVDDRRELGFARGGILGRVNNWVGRGWQALVGQLKDTAARPLNALRDAVGDRFGRGDHWGGIPYHMVADWKKKILNRFGEEDAMGAGGKAAFGSLDNVSAGLRRGALFVKRTVGRPYLWGGGGPRFDCSGYMAGIQNAIMNRNPPSHYGRLYSTHSFNGGTPPGWQRGLNSPFTVGVQHSGVGHMAGTLLGVNAESSGSRGTHAGRTARGTSSFPHRFGFMPVVGGKAQGGIVGAAPWASRDMGGILPDKAGAVNTSGQAEVVHTLDQLKAVVAAARGGTTINIHSLTLDAKNVRDFQAAVDTLENLERTARQHGAKVQVRRP